MDWTKLVYKCGESYFGESGDTEFTLFFDGRLFVERQARSHDGLGTAAHNSFTLKKGTVVRLVQLFESFFEQYGYTECGATDSAMIELQWHFPDGTFKGIEFYHMPNEEALECHKQLTDILYQYEPKEKDRIAGNVSEPEAAIHWRKLSAHCLCRNQSEKMLSADLSTSGELKRSISKGLKSEEKKTQLILSQEELNRALELFRSVAQDLEQSADPARKQAANQPFIQLELEGIAGWKRKLQFFGLDQFPHQKARLADLLQLLFGVEVGQEVLELKS